MQPLVVPSTEPAKPGQFNYHDLRVIGFQVLIAAAQAALIKLGAYHFGMWDPYIAMAVQIFAEALRRFAVTT